jgi:DNA mismatch repair protein MSH6
MWTRAVSCAAELDCLVSLAAVSTQPGMTRPVFIEQAAPFLDVRSGVNICVQAAQHGMECIPNDIRIGAEESAEGGVESTNGYATPCMLVVTGPNMGGKSTILRQACLTTLMAHLGCHVPATSCRLSPVDQIFTRVGANDAIMAGLSTFRVELEETAQILKHATPRSLVILDELGRGTATFDGMAIAHASMWHLLKAARCRVLFATHYHSLTRDFERPNPHVALYHMACHVDEAPRITFLYKFRPGACNRSHGVNVARLAGLPESLLGRAAEKSAKLEGLLEDQRLLQLLRNVLALDEARGARALAVEAHNS